jgi:hypothetical protein
MSILRWLTLGEGEILELECGEDIDIIQDEIAKGRFRILEQIKVSGNKLTLNSPGPKASLVNFRKHLLANPTQRLAFRFVTTAEITVERLHYVSTSKSSKSASWSGRSERRI